MRINDREKKVLLIGAISLLIAALYQWGLVPVMDNQELVKSKLAAKELILAKSNAKIIRTEQLKVKTKAVEEQIARLEKRLLKGKTPSLAAAELQKIIKKIANENKIQVSSEKVLTPVISEEYQKIPVRVALKGLMTNLTKALHKIETNSTALTISETRIKIINSRDPSMLETTLTISGVIKTTETELQKTKDKKAKTKKRK